MTERPEEAGAEGENSDLDRDRDAGSDDRHSSIVRYDEEAAIDGTIRGDDSDDLSGPTSPEPLGDLASDLADRPDRSADAADELFDREDLEEIDEDGLWERIESGDAVDELVGDDREIREVDKRTYCHQCKHFADPPSVGCTREGTDILELPTLETFRVADCPVVLEDEKLDRDY